MATTAVDASGRAQRHQPGPTLLPAPVAQAVSLATRSTSLAIQFGSLVSSFGLDAARVTALSSLELARGMIEGVMSRAAKDTLAQAQTELAAANAESVLERGLGNLHYAVTQAVFWTSVSFRLTGTTLSTASEGSQLLLSSLDQLFGSTDSSRAVASIITLIRREFQSPATGLRGERIGVVDLTLALSTLAYLQQSCRRTAEEERRRQSYEEVIWDVVVLSDGERIDVDEGVLNGIQGGYGNRKNEEHPSPPPQPPPLPPRSPRYGGDDEAVVARLRNQIAASLSPGTTVSVSNSVSSVQTITVDVHGPQLLSLRTPPGAEIVETRALTPSGSRRSWISLSQEDEGVGLSYRVVYKIHRDKFTTSSYKGDSEGSVAEVADEMYTAGDRAPGPAKAAPVDTQSSGPSSPVSPVSPPPVSVPSRIPSANDVRRRSATAQQDFSRPTAASARRKTTDVGSNATSRTSTSAPFHLEDLEATANQKRPRAPLHGTKAQDTKRPPTKKKTENAICGKTVEKKNRLKHVLRRGSQSMPNVWDKKSTATTDGREMPSKLKAQERPQDKHAATASSGKLKSGNQNQAHHRDHSSRLSVRTPEPQPRSPSRTSYVSIHNQSRDSIVSQTDTFSANSLGGLRPASPTVVRAEYATHESVARLDKNQHGEHLAPGHRRIRSYDPSVHSFPTNDSQTSLVLSSYYQKSAYHTADALCTLRCEGYVNGTFPAGHLLSNITRYMRFSSASYGSHFLKLMGISNNMPTVGVWDGTHDDVRHFAHHTGSKADNILLASFVDPQGGSDSSGSTETGVPLVHYISLDHEAKAVVLACRGTMGFEDVLADLTCDYDRLAWRGRGYRVHKGIHASARRLLYGGDGRVLVTLEEALDEFPDYGLVLCGHSLGAGVTSLLGVMLSEPNPDGPGFVTSAEPYTPKPPANEAPGDGKLGEIRLPAGRRIHVYAYGPPGVMSPSLGKITRGLITSVVHGNDLVPHLSLGLLRDFQALSLAFKRDENGVKADIRSRIWHAFQDNVTDRWYPFRHASKIASGSGAGEEELWMLPALDGMRASMSGEKLLPPGEVFAVETQRVLRRDAFLLVGEEHIGRPAQRIVLKYVRDVEGRFGEVRFGTSMLKDHSPAKYEDALNRLRVGVAE